MGTIYGDKRFRKNPSLANTPDGQTTIGDIPEMPDRKRSVNDNDEKILANDFNNATGRAGNCLS